jgi:hypothetical protein
MVKQPARPSGAQLECRASSCFAARAQLLRLPLFQIVHDVVQQWADRGSDRDFVLETIVTRMPQENYAQVFGTFVRRVRFGWLFEYDTETQRLRLGSTRSDSSPPSRSEVAVPLRVVPIELARDLADRLTRLGLKALAMRHEAAARPSRALGPNAEPSPH